MDQKQKNDSKTDKPFVHDAAGCSLAWMTVAAVLWLVLMSIRVLTYLSSDKSSDANQELCLSVLFLTIVFAAVESFVWVLWQIIVYRGKRKEQIENDSKAVSSDPKICLPPESGEQSKEDSKAVSPILNIAAALSCGGAVLVGLIWLVLYFMAGYEILPPLSAFIEVPLLTLWGVCADRKNKIALNIDNPKRNTSFLNLAVCFSFFCLTYILIFIFALSERFMTECSHALGPIAPFMAVFACFSYLAYSCAPVAVPILFIRNIYAHLKWRNRAKQEVRDRDDLPRDRTGE